MHGSRRSRRRPTPASSSSPPTAMLPTAAVSCSSVRIWSVRPSSRGSCSRNSPAARATWPSPIALRASLPSTCVSRAQSRAPPKAGLNVVNVYNTNPSDMASELATIKDILKANPNLAAIMPLCGPDTAAAGLVRKEMNLTHPIVGCDLMYQTLELIKSGHIDATIGQQPYMQGYMPITYAYQRAILGAPKLELPGGNYFMANEDRHQGQRRCLPDPREALPGMSDGSEFRLSALRYHQAVRWCARARFGELRRACRGDPWSPRRQRRRQIHIDRRTGGGRST